MNIGLLLLRQQDSDDNAKVDDSIEDSTTSLGFLYTWPSCTDYVFRVCFNAFSFGSLSRPLFSALDFSVSQYGSQNIKVISVIRHFRSHLREAPELRYTKRLLQRTGTTNRPRVLLAFVA